MKVLDALLDLLDRLLQVAVPPRSRRIAYVSYPDYADNAYYVFQRAVRTRASFEHVWLVRDLSLCRRIERDFTEAVRASGARGHTLAVHVRASLRGYWAFLRSRTVFHTHGAYRFRSRAWRRQIVCLWHGMPIKCVGRLNRITPNPYPTFGTLHIATSPFFRDIIAAAFEVPTEVVKLCSLPRCDALQVPGAARTSPTQVRDHLSLPAQCRLVLWMPTYRAEGALAQVTKPRSFLDDLPQGALAALDAAAGRADSVVLIKLHPLDPLNHGTPPWPWRHVRLLASSEWTASGIQLYDLLAASDALISDVSSVLIDYLVTGRPIGVLGFNPATYTRELTFPFEKLLATGRFDLLDAPGTFETFLGRRDTVSGDTFAYLRFELPGSEQILREAGL